MKIKKSLFLEFLEDNFDSLLILILIIIALIFAISAIHARNEERLAFINNNKENVIKYNICEHIEDYYYCWND